MCMLCGSRAECSRHWQWTSLRERERELHADNHRGPVRISPTLAPHVTQRKLIVGQTSQAHPCAAAEPCWWTRVQVRRAGGVCQRHGVVTSAAATAIDEAGSATSERAFSLYHSLSLARRLSLASLQAFQRDNPRGRGQRSCQGCLCWARFEVCRKVGIDQSLAALMRHKCNNDRGSFKGLRCHHRPFPSQAK